MISKDGGVQTEESNKFIFSDNYSDDNYLDVEKANTEEDEALKEHLEGISQELELERSQNASIKENIELQPVIEILAKGYKEFAENVGKQEEELTEHKTELINKARKLSAEVEGKDLKINTLTTLNKALKQDIKEIETKNSEQQWIAEIYMK
ncbi:hypothetical protein [Wolbachia endosymbiont of Mansonella perstans]|uniref:hypothetical protein n=1 Tax=Wolbachia endosymbiont of Mansonella perstans TaxID=229526 RepID=UPI001CE0BCC6|nr:hypothetical protein [Wolbachia endosymbiont of Mansonella perstans]MCA4773731.1 hypothetical protein [Wolbachia endosymbiont of Mansonella perstans]